MALQSSSVDTIFLHSHVTLQEELPPVSRALNIIGLCEGFCVIDANQGFRVFAVEGGGNLNLTSVSLVNGNADKGGAIIIRDNSAVTFHSCSVMHHVAGWGGGVYVTGNSSLALFDCEIADTTADVLGGFLYAESSNFTLEGCISSSGRAEEGGFAYFTSGSGVTMTATISRSAFTNFQTSNSAGVFQAFGIILSVHESVFAENYSPFGGVMHGTSIIASCSSSVLADNSAFAVSGGLAYGGALRVVSHTQLEVVDCLASNNSATDYGGFIASSSDSQVYVLQTEFQNNTADNGGVIFITQCALQVMTSWFFMNNATVGGAVSSQNSSVLTVNTTFESNQASMNGSVFFGEYGAAALHSTVLLSNTAVHHGALYSGNSQLQLNGTRCNNNTAHKGACAYLAGETDYSIWIIQSEIRGNAVERGAVIDTEGVGSIEVVDSTIDDNFGVAIGLTNSFAASVKDSIISSGVAQEGAAMTISEGAMAVLEDSVLRDNVADLNGGAVQCALGAVRFVGVVIEQNSAGSFGGAIASVACDLVLSGSKVLANSAASGGAVTVQRGGVVFQECTVSRNSAGEGGVIYGDLQATVHFESTELRSNSASERGGVVMTDGNVTLTDSTAISNDAGWGLLYLARSQATTAMLNVSFLNNTALGGVILYCAGCAGAHMAGCTFVENTAVTNGGVITLEGANGNTELEGCILSRNSAGQSGGIINSFGREVLENTIRVHGSNFTANTAHDGGCIHCSDVRYILITSSSFLGNEVAGSGGAMYVRNAEVTLTSSYLQTNTAGTSGGGIQLLMSHLAVADTVLRTNRGETMGGGILAQEESQVLMDDCFLSYNIAIDGAALALQSLSSATINGTTFYNNNASGGGGGLLVDEDGRVTMERSVLRLNHAHAGGAVCVWMAEVLMADCNITQNTASLGGGAYMGNSHVSIEDSMLAQNSALESGGALYMPGQVLDAPIRWTDVVSHAPGLARTDLNRVKLVGNSADRHGGGMFAGNFTTVALNRGSLERNSAVSSGGGMYYDTLVNDCSLQHADILSNNASAGSACYLNFATGNTTVLKMQNLTLSDNLARIGGSVHWMVDLEHRGSDIVPPSCDQCTGFDHLSTNTVRISIEQEGSGASISHLQVDSNGVVQPKIIYMARDFYGAPVLSLEELTVRIETCPEMILAGSLYSLYGSYFDSLILEGAPGVQCELQFVISDGRWPNAAVNFSINYCVSGEWHNEEALRCNPCSEDYIKFSNTSTPCTECTQEGLKCKGGNEFYVEDGYWIPTEWLQEECLDLDDPTCLLHAVYECRREQACEQEEVQRANVNGEMYIAEDLLCGSGYTVATALCASCSEGYYYVISSMACISCPASIVWTWLQAASIAVALIGICALLYKFQDVLVDGIFADALKRKESLELLRKALLNVVLGHVQVVSQTVQLYSSSNVPWTYRWFLVPTQSVTFSIVSWIPLSCMYASLGVEGTSETDFYATFGFATSTAAVITVIFMYNLKSFVSTHLHMINLVVSESTRQKLSSFFGGEADGNGNDNTYLHVSNVLVNDAECPAILLDEADDSPPEEQGYVTPIDTFRVPTDGNGSTADGGQSWRNSDIGENYMLHAGAPANPANIRDSALPLPRDDTEQRGLERWSNPPQQEHDNSPRVDSEPVFDAVVLVGEAAVQPVEKPAIEQPEQATTELQQPIMLINSGEAAASCKEGRQGPQQSRFSLAPGSRRGVFRGIVLGNLMMLLHPSCATVCFQLFDCVHVYKTVDSEWWLRADMGAQCYTLNWYIHAAVSVFIIVIYVMGFPLILIWAPAFLEKHYKVKCCDSHEEFFIDKTEVPAALWQQSASQQMRALTRTLQARPAEHSSSQGKGSKSEAGSINIVHKGKQRSVIPQCQLEGGEMVFETMLGHPRIQSTIGVFFIIYKRECRPFAGYHMLFKVMQTSFVVAVSQLHSKVALNYGIFATSLALAIDNYIKPYSMGNVNTFQAFFHLLQVQSLTIVSARAMVDGADTVFAILGLYVGLIQVAAIGLVMKEWTGTYDTSRVQQMLKSFKDSTTRTFKFPVTQRTTETRRKEKLSPMK
ncbi:hypothetical protein CYMTET_48366 [Cymbomonas tetramitiformis]|uniref:Uncharacterized protein n=1 Tax=Cymbomonas tetramitiformis TaxID=36881 RepID=A0AAE0BSF0_9CHLO|nr:hypothetical protein CYMTET_48366 [Cymbomonas tetramitiformis]